MKGMPDITSAVADRWKERQREDLGPRTIILEGTCPSKKNLYRRAKNGRMYLSADVKAQLDSLSWQALTQRPRHPLIHPNMEVEFHVASERGDRDGKLASLLDCLQQAEIIKNDNIKQFNGTVTILPAKLAVREKVIIRIL